MKQWINRNVRFLAQHPARLEAGGRSVDVVVRNITKGFRGVGLEATKPVELFPGTKVKLHLVHEGLAVVMNGVVRWSKGGTLVGLEVHSVAREELPTCAQNPVQPAPSQEEDTADTSGSAPDQLDSFSIQVDPVAGEIVCCHVAPDGTIDHTVRRATAEEVLAEMLKPEWVSGLDRAARLAGELTKAEAALSLRIPYAQGEPLRKT
ncbi:MAG TPA: hypothetical protein GXX28_00615, partial [Firmicutes bacterium]|nr:hypothetical protein [Bacillota bacterium]